MARRLQKKGASNETTHLHVLRRTDAGIGEQLVTEPEYLRLVFEPGRRDGGLRVDRPSLPQEGHFAPGTCPRREGTGL